MLPASMIESARKPDWLRAKLPSGPDFLETKKNVDEHKLHTVCQSAQCPNMGECWSRGTATVMILGNVCTRSCTFCAVQSGRPSELDLGEPARVAESIAQMKLRHVVITSVARDDLKDGVDTLLDARPDILNHNLETVERLQRPVRKTARYDRSFWVLKHAKSRDFITKTGIMLGIGERKDEVAQLLRDIAAAQVDIVTIGQYLSPSKEHAPIDRWVTPEEFAEWKAFALEVGVKHVESGPLVRSSYKADEQVSKFSLMDRRQRPAR
jgi:lipoic acid synthetase